MNLVTLLEEFHHISGLRLSIYDTAFHEIAAYPMTVSNFCSLLWQNPVAKDCCNKNHMKIFEHVKETMKPSIFHCEFGLYEAVAPLEHDGVLNGFLKMEQTLDKDNIDTSYIFEKALPHIQDEEVLKEQIKNIPSSSKEQLMSCMNIMQICGEYISLSNRINLNEKKLAEEIKNYIESNYDSKLSLEILCNYFFYSKPTIMNAFKNTFHKSINRFIQETRLNHAIHLLDHTDDSIYNISKLCGFTDQNYFTKVFLKEFGMTPTHFRKQRAS